MYAMVIHVFPAQLTKQCFLRHLKNKQAANELLSKLKDNRELQHFLQDGQEVIFANMFSTISFLSRKNILLICALSVL